MALCDTFIFIHHYFEHTCMLQIIQTSPAVCVHKLICLRKTDSAVSQLTFWLKCVV